jgi:nucleoside-diphosphate-sugar epimerase
MAAEQCIRHSRLRWTILRPTMIYGTGQDRNFSRLIRFLARTPIVPIFGSGEFLMQPIHVEDLAHSIAQVLGSEAAMRKAYNLAGANPLTYNDAVRTICRLMGKRPPLLHLPARPLVWLLRAAERLSIRPPIRAEQIERLNEHKAFAWDEAARDFGFRPRTFAEGIRREILELGLGRGSGAPV